MIRGLPRTRSGSSQPNEIRGDPDQQLVDGRTGALQSPSATLCGSKQPGRRDCGSVNTYREQPSEAVSIEIPPAADHFVVVDRHLNWRYDALLTASGHLRDGPPIRSWRPLRHIKRSPPV